MKRPVRFLALVIGIALLPQVAVRAHETSAEPEFAALYAEAFAKPRGMSVETASEAIAESRHLYDFMVANSANPLFGGIWAEYAPYQVHVRFAQPVLTTECELDTLPEVESSAPDSVPTTVTVPESSAPATVAVPDSSVPATVTVPESSAPETMPTTVATPESSLPPPPPSGFRHNLPAGTDCDSIATLTDALEQAVAGLEQTISSSVIRSDGGASHAEVMAVVNAVKSGSISIAYKADRRRGAVVVYDEGSIGVVSSLIRREYVEVAAPLPPAQDLAAQGGSLLTTCTAAFAFNNVSNYGIGTAGHCNDSQSIIETSEALNVIAGHSTCTPTDYQLMVATTSPGNDLTGRLSGGGESYVTLHGVAGGFNPTQPLFVYTTQGPTIAGEADDYGSSYEPDGGGCDGIIATDGAWFDLDSAPAPGDSGSPVVLFYGSERFLWIILKGPAATHAFGSGWYLPSGASICTNANPC